MLSEKNYRLRGLGYKEGPGEEGMEEGELLFLGPYLRKIGWLGDLGHKQIFDLRANFLSFSRAFC